MKGPQNQLSTVRKPLQERARQKVELILEAAIRLLDKGGLAVLTTNAVAEKAGVIPTSGEADSRRVFPIAWFSDSP